MLLWLRCLAILSDRYLLQHSEMVKLLTMCAVICTDVLAFALYKATSGLHEERLRMMTSSRARPGANFRRMSLGATSSGYS